MPNNSLVVVSSHFCFIASAVLLAVAFGEVLTVISLRCFGSEIGGLSGVKIVGI